MMLNPLKMKPANSTVALFIVLIVAFGSWHDCKSNNPPVELLTLKWAWDCVQNVLAAVASEKKKKNSLHLLI